MGHKPSVRGTTLAVTVSADIPPPSTVTYSLVSATGLECCSVQVDPDNIELSPLKLESTFILTVTDDGVKEPEQRYLFQLSLSTGIFLLQSTPKPAVSPLSYPLIPPP